jgi:hypothetical protein
MKLEDIRAEIERMRTQIQRQRKDIPSLQRAGISTLSAEALLARMQTTVDNVCADRDRLVGERRLNTGAPIKRSGVRKCGFSSYCRHTALEVRRRAGCRR